MLKSVDHDSMSGEQVRTTSGLVITSGKSEIWPLQPLKIRDVESYENPPQGREKDLGKIDKYHMRGGRTLPSMLGKMIFDLSCCYEHYRLSVR
jgi:hypothetical protein